MVNEEEVVVHVLSKKNKRTEKYLNKIKTPSLVKKKKKIKNKVKRSKKGLKKKIKKSLVAKVREMDAVISIMGSSVPSDLVADRQSVAEKLKRFIEHRSSRRKRGSDRSYQRRQERRRQMFSEKEATADIVPVLPSSSGLVFSEKKFPDPMYEERQYLSHYDDYGYYSSD